jgi:predicted ATPase
VLDLLTQLVLKSLVMTKRGGAEVRYSLLETVRQYSRGLLEDASEAGRVQSIPGGDRPAAAQRIPEFWPELSAWCPLSGAGRAS